MTPRPGRPGCRPLAALSPAYAPATAPADGPTLAAIAEWIVNELGYPLDSQPGTKPPPEPLKWPIARAWAAIDPEKGTTREWYRICQTEGNW